MAGPVDTSKFNYVKLSFKEGFDPIFILHLQDALARKFWERFPLIISATQSTSEVRSFYGFQIKFVTFMNETIEKYS